MLLFIDPNISSLRRSATLLPHRRRSIPPSVIPAKTGIHPIIRHSHEGGNPSHHPSFPRRRESIPSSVIPAKTGIREGGNPSHHPSFPRRRESIPSSVIPAKTGIHPIIRHSHEGGNPSHHPSFPRRRESIPPSVIPAKAGIHPIIRHSREGGNPSHHPSFPSGIHPIIRHSREGGNPHPSFPLPRECNPFPRTRESHPSFPRRRVHPIIPWEIPARRESIPIFVIPAWECKPVSAAAIHPIIRHSHARAGIHPKIRHSREGGNPSHHPSFPRRRESIPSSVIPAKAGIHPTSVIPAKAGIHPTPSVIPAKAGSIPASVIPGIHPIIRHSREGGNPSHHPSFPRRRESIPSSVIPAKAGIHNSRARGNSSFLVPSHPSLPQFLVPTLPRGNADLSLQRQIPKQPKGSHAGAWEPENLVGDLPDLALQGGTLLNACYCVIPAWVRVQTHCVVYCQKPLVNFSASRLRL